MGFEFAGGGFDFFEVVAGDGVADSFDFFLKGGLEFSRCIFTEFSELFLDGEG